MKILFIQLQSIVPDKNTFGKGSEDSVETTESFLFYSWFYRNDDAIAFGIPFVFMNTKIYL